MFRYLLIAGIILVSLTTFQLYEVSYSTNDVRSNISLLKAEIVREKERINKLRFKISEAKKPSNLANLNHDYIKLVPQKIEQFITIEQLPAEKVAPLPEAGTLSNSDQANFDPIGALAAEIITPVSQ